MDCQANDGKEALGWRKPISKFVFKVLNLILFSKTCRFCILFCKERKQMKGKEKRRKSKIEEKKEASGKTMQSIARVVGLYRTRDGFITCVMETSRESRNHWYRASDRRITRMIKTLSERRLGDHKHHA